MFIKKFIYIFAIIEKEIWKDIENYEGFYQISNHGRVKSLERYRICRKGGKYFQKEKILLLQKEKKGYSTIRLCKNGKQKTFKVHRLVGFAFLNTYNKINKPFINHKNCIKDDNYIKNLEWISNLENIRHAWDNNLIKVLKGEKNKNSKLTEKQVIKIRKLYSTKNYTLIELASFFNVGKSTIGYIVNNKSWKHI